MPRVTTVPYETTQLVRDCCLCLHLQRAARALARRFDEALRPLGVTNGQFSLMTALNRPVPPGIGTVASLLAMDRTTVTGAIKPLERRGFVKVLADPDDQRGRLIILTPKGMDLLAAAVPVWESMHRQAEKLLTHGKPNRFRKNLRSLS